MDSSGNNIQEFLVQISKRHYVHEIEFRQTSCFAR